MESIKKSKTSKEYLEILEYFYELYCSWDDYGELSEDIANMIISLLERDDCIIGVHRTGGDGSIDIDNIYSSETLYNMFLNGLYMTGSSFEGTFSKEALDSPSKNISPIQNILHAVIYLKSAYKDSNTAIIIAVPKTLVDKDYHIITDEVGQLFNVVHDNVTLKPEFLVGAVLQNNGVCTEFISREQFLKEYENNIILKSRQNL